MQKAGFYHTRVADPVVEAQLAARRDANRYLALALFATLLILALATVLLIMNTTILGNHTLRLLGLG